MPKAKARAKARATPDDGLALAERAVEKALARGADAAEAFAVDDVGTSLRIERGALSGGESGRDAGLGIRVLKRGRLAFAFATDEARIDAAIDAALASTRVLPASRRFLFPRPAKATSVARIRDARLLAWTVEDAARACDGMIEAALDAAPGATVAGGGVAWGEERVAIASSTGLRGAYAGTTVGGSVYLVLRDGADTTTGFDSRSSRRLDIDWAGVGREAGDLAARSRRAERVADGTTTVLLRPEAFAGLFEFLFLGAVTGEAAASRQSVYAGRRGERVMPREFGVVDDGALAGGVGSAPFDDEGVPTRATPIVAKGALKGFLEDAAGAAERGSRPTASAIRTTRFASGRTFRAPPKATGRNLVLTGPARSLDRLVRDVKRGVLVHDAMGAHTANAASGDFSVNSSTAFRIEDGEVVGAAKPVMVSGNLPAALAGLVGMGRDARTVGGSFTPASLVVPTVRLDGLRVTG